MSDEASADEVVLSFAADSSGRVLLVPASSDRMGPEELSDEPVSEEAVLSEMSDGELSAVLTEEALFSEMFVVELPAEEAGGSEVPSGLLTEEPELHAARFRRAAEQRAMADIRVKFIFFFDFIVVISVHWYHS